jgi:hypothetical protein
MISGDGMGLRVVIGGLGVVVVAMIIIIILL